jgi:hypothetical protein
MFFIRGASFISLGIMPYLVHPGVHHTLSFIEGRLDIYIYIYMYIYIYIYSVNLGNIIMVH